ncbi:MAG: helix-turn-helix domain-containing protein [Candidatus Zixiibacteriota bacterium]
MREKEEVKKSILDAARKIALREGWNCVTIRKIADEIEYTPPIVYEHFESKEDLIKELIYMGFRLLQKEVKKVKQSQKDPKKLLKLLSLVHWDFAFSNIELHQLMFSLERPTPSEEMVYNFGLTKSIFLEISQGNELLAEELVLNWVCLIEGAISTMMQLPPPPSFKKTDTRKLYIKMIERFINSM